VSLYVVVYTILAILIPILDSVQAARDHSGLEWRETELTHPGGPGGGGGCGVLVYVVKGAQPTSTC